MNNIEAFESLTTEQQQAEAKLVITAGPNTDPKVIAILDEETGEFVSLDHLSDQVAESA